jgi:hypothetical protein
MTKAKQITREDRSWLWTWENQWPQLWKQYNWSTYTFFELSFQNDSMMGAYEAVFIVLGFGFNWRWNHTETDFTKQMNEQIESIQADLAAGREVSMKVPEGVDKDDPQAVGEAIFEVIASGKFSEPKDDDPIH